ncbi:hypothetical protein AVEN_218991-1 [Araneus ventricosus]|uniref:Uncharacterized protein n=1 Tax=Araneus ventricosus TaxID=182803 RepID=A0A4Y2CBY5_ARAVE|nr:hypothetical protein AVEN_218991-1 [Araneus ventricosus]
MTELQQSLKKANSKLPQIFAEALISSESFSLRSMGHEIHILRASPEQIWTFLRCTCLIKRIWREILSTQKVNIMENVDVFYSLLPIHYQLPKYTPKRPHCYPSSAMNVIVWMIHVFWPPIDKT